MSRQKLLMCAPDYFGIDYVINPWMEGNKGLSDHILAIQQWVNLKQTLEAQADITFIPPQRGFPDMVFTANAGFVLNGRAVFSRFRAKERQGEEPFFEDWFKSSGLTLEAWPEDVCFEGAGDALLDRGQDLIWAGYGFRSDQAAAPLLERMFKRRTIALQLVDPRFYHLDTCLCPLEGGILLYFPGAFDEASQKIIADTVSAEKRLVVDEADAEKFCCNAVDLNRHVFMNGASEALQNRLRIKGFTPVLTPLSEFMKAGGAAKCLTLKLHEKEG